jgi:hypothetical protein
MTSPQEIIDQARRGPVPADWRVFTQPRGRVGAFFRGTSGHPDPVLVITLDAAVEYTNDREPLSVMYFAWVAGASMRLRATTTSDSHSVRLRFWVDVRLTDGRTVQWKSATFPARIDVVQRFVEGCVIHAFWQRLSAGGYGPAGQPCAPGWPAG